MFAAVSEEMIDTMGVAGTAHQVREQLRRYEGVLDHIMLYSPSVGIVPERVQQNLDSIIRKCSPASDVARRSIHVQPDPALPPKSTRRRVRISGSAAPTRCWPSLTMQMMPSLSMQTSFGSWSTW